MQRVAIIVPFSNLTVEEEFHRYINNPELVYQVFKLDYLTHKCDNEKFFYYELEGSLNELVGKLSFVDFDKIINLCSSLNATFDHKSIDSNVILKEHIRNTQSEITLFVSPYSTEVTKNITGFLELNSAVEYVFLEHSIDYYMFSNSSLKYLAKQNLGSLLISCTNIPTMDLIYNHRCNIISTNHAVINYLNKLS